MSFVKFNHHFKVLFFSGAVLAGFAARADIVLPSEGTAEADPEFYLYSITLNAGCFADDEAVTKKVEDLKQKVSIVLAPFKTETEKDEAQFFLTSNNLPSENEADIPVYNKFVSVNGKEVPQILCSEGRWAYSETYQFKLPDASKRLAFQKAVTKVKKENFQGNPDNVGDKETWSITVGSAAGRLSKETEDRLYKEAYADALASVVKEYRVIKVAEGKAENTHELSDIAIKGAIIGHEEKSSQTFERPMYALASESGRGGGAPMNSGIKKLKRVVNFTFTFKND